MGPSPIMLGVVAAGDSVQTTVSVRNPRSAPITLERIETGCSCISVAPVPIEIGPGERRVLTVTFDSSSDPEFDGDLSIEIIGYVADDTVAFRAEAKVSILP